MSLVISLFIAGALSYALRGPIRRMPLLFYGIALAVAVIMATNAIAAVSPIAARVLFPYLQQGVLAFAFLSVVMFVGVLPEGRIQRALRPIRGELSIIASIFIAGHVAHYANPMLTRVFSSGLGSTPGTFVGTLLSVLLVILLVVLTVTSFKVVRTAMRPSTWKRVQLLAYPFYLLIFCHVFAMLLPSAVASGTKAFVSVVLYALIAVIYVAARLYRAYANRRVKSESGPVAGDRLLESSC